MSSRIVDDYGVDWFVHRIAISEEYRAAPREIRAWPLLDVVHAHAVLDTLEEVRAVAEASR